MYLGSEPWTLARMLNTSDFNCDQLHPWADFSFYYLTCRGIVASILVFLCFGVTQAKDGPFSRPHPGMVLASSVSNILVLKLFSNFKEIFMHITHEYWSRVSTWNFDHPSAFTDAVWTVEFLPPVVFFLFHLQHLQSLVQPRNLSEENAWSLNLSDYLAKFTCSFYLCITDVISLESNWYIADV